MKNQVGAIIIRNFKLTKRNTSEKIAIIVPPILINILLILLYRDGETDSNIKELIENFFHILVPFTVLFAITGYQRSLLVFLVNERKEGFREIHRVMGLKYASYILGNLIYSSLICLILIFFALSGVCFLSLISFNGIYFHAIVSICLFTFAAISFILCFSRIFNDPELASDFSTLIILASVALSLISGKSQTYFQYFLYAFSWIPQINLIASNIASLNDSYSDIYLLQLYQCGNILFYFLLYLYLEKVLPNEFGKRESPFFFFKNCRNRNYENLVNESETQLIEIDNPTSALVHEKLQINSENKKIISITSVSKKFGNFDALSKVSLTIYDNSIFALLGPNGAGKTTLINILSGALPPSAGQIFVNSLNVHANSDSFVGKIGLCPQFNILYDNLSLFEHLSYIARIKGIDKADEKQQIDQIINLLQLENYTNSEAKTLSLGTKRKLCLGMALLGNPEILLLDEPSSGLDTQSRKEFLKFIKNLKKSGVAILLTTQHLEEAEELADETAILSKGLILVQGSNTFIKNKFGGGDKINIMQKKSAENLIDLKELVLNNYENAEIVENSEKSISIKINVYEKSSLKFVQAIEENNLEFSVRRQTLEDAFVNLSEDPLTYLEKEGIPIEEDLLERFNSNVEDITLELNQAQTLKTQWHFISRLYAIIKKRILLSFLSIKNILLLLFPCILSNVNCFVIFYVFVDLERETYINYALQTPILILNIVIMLTFFMTTVFYNSSYVKEKEEGMKLMLRTMGVNRLEYWAGSMIADIILFTIQISLILLSMVIPILMKLYKFYERMWSLNEFNTMKQFNDPSFIVNMLGKNFLMFGFLFIGVSHLFSQFFGLRSSALRWFNFYLIIIFIIIPLIFIFFLILVFTKTELFSVYLFDPFLTLFYETGNEIAQERHQLKMPLELYVFIYGTLFSLLNYLVDCFSFVRLPSERNSTLDESIQNNELVKINYLSKQFKSNMLSSQIDKQAVSEVSMSIYSGRVFAIVGPNGAGKSTLISMISSKLQPTSGSVNFNRKKNTFKKDFIFERALVGVCEQKNIFFDDLTVYQNLSVFADIKGFWWSSKKKFLKIVIKSFQLKNEKHKIANHLSGGNKRKLCMAISFINNSPVLILDEPTTGVDPIFRKNFQKIIEYLKLNCGFSVILASNSMDEVDKLADDIGILVNGKLKIQGNLEELKQTYRLGFHVQAKIRDNVSDDILGQYLQNSLKDTTVVFSSNRKECSFRVEKIKYSEILAELQATHEAGHIEDFSICNSSFEQLYFMHASSENTSNINIQNNQKEIKYKAVFI